MRTVIDYLTFVVDVVGLFMLFHAQFERRVKPVFYWTAAVLSGIIYWNALSYVGVLSANMLGKLPINVAWALCVAALYKGSWIKRIFIAGIHHIILIGIDVFLYGLVVHFSGFTMQEVLTNASLSIFLAVLCHIVLFAIFFSLAKFLRSRREQVRIPIWEWLSIVSIVAFTVIQLYININGIIDNTSTSPLLPIQAVLLMLITIALLLLFNKLATQNKIQQENTFLQEQMYHERLRLQAATESYEAQRTLTHDFDNRFLAVEQLLEYGKQDEALSYVREVRASVAQTDVAVSTNNPLADAVLNQKYRRALELGIGMQFLVSDLSTFPLTGDELVTVLSNLLDNALEACQKIRTDGNIHQSLSIRVKLLMEDQLATISVKNTSASVSVDADGEVETTKKLCNLHGFGLRTCKKILKRSGFDFVVHYQNGWFQFTAMKTF